MQLFFLPVLVAVQLPYCMVRAVLVRVLHVHGARSTRTIYSTSTARTMHCLLYCVLYFVLVRTAVPIQL